MDLRNWWTLVRSVSERRRARIDNEASDVAQRSRRAVLGRVGDEAREMGRFELRGYVRARAAMVIHREAGRLLMGRRQVSDPIRAQLVDLATRQVVDLVVADLVETWAWHRGHRAAA